MVEVILQETKDIVCIGPNSIITETHSGTISANAGVDRSNVAGERNVVPLPKKPHASAEGIRQEIKRLSGVDVAVIVSDTHGRPFRMGEINVAVGVAGFKPIRDRRGEKDLFVCVAVKRAAVADELASAAGVGVGQATGISSMSEDTTIYQPKMPPCRYRSKRRTSSGKVQKLIRQSE
jgi:coenzyme F420-0:L-glutamate ligase/coenzyme F420-1:gamma-L-glutamate ligase